MLVDCAWYSTALSNCAKVDTILFLPMQSMSVACIIWANELKKFVINIAPFTSCLVREIRMVVREVYATQDDSHVIYLFLVNQRDRHYSLVSRKPLLMLTNLLGMFICNWLVVTCNGLLADGTRENIASYFFAELFESLPYVTWAILWVRFLFWVILRCWEYFSLPWDLGLVKNSFLQFLGHHDVCVIIILYAVVLCPLSVTDGWVSEVAKFAPKLRVLRYVGDKDHRCNLRREMFEHVIEQSSPSYVSFESCCCIQIPIWKWVIKGLTALRWSLHFNPSRLPCVLFVGTAITFWRAIDYVRHSIDGSGFSFSNSMALCNHRWSTKT